MPTRQEWIDSLFESRKLKIISSQDMINRIHAEQRKRIDKLNKNTKPIPPMKTTLTTVSEDVPFYITIVKKNRFTFFVLHSS